LAEVLVRVYAALKDKMGWGELRVSHEAGTLADLLKQAKGRAGSLYELVVGGDGRPLPSFLLLVNGRDIEFLKGLETEIKPGDTVVILPPLAGGGLLTQR